MLERLDPPSDFLGEIPDPPSDFLDKIMFELVSIKYIHGLGTHTLTRKTQKLWKYLVSYYVVNILNHPESDNNDLVF